MSKNLPKGNKHHNWSGGKTKGICIICSKIFYYYPKWQTGKFCSSKCANIHLGKKQYGINNPSWKGGLLTQARILRNSDKYNIWRQDILIRDNFTCQKCGKRGGKLEAHHKKPFYKLVEEAKYNLPLLSLYEACILYTPLWDLGNGETNCEKCHKKPGRPKN